MSIALGPLSWQTIGDNFVCLTILIDLEEITVLCLILTFLIMLMNFYHLLSRVGMSV